MSILLFVLLVNASMSYTNTLNLWGGQTFQTYPWTASAFQAGSQCTTENNNGSITCTPSISNAAFASTFFVFGDFFGGLLAFVATMIEGVLLPYFILVNWGVPVGLAAIINTAVWFDYFVLIVMFRSGRYI